MNPMAIDAVQTIQDSLPTVAATAPMENSTRGGTPLATQKAPVQSMPRSRPALLAPASGAATSAIEFMVRAPRRVQRGRGDPSGGVQEKTVRTACVVHRQFR